MSRGDILFSSRSLARVALAVEWEDELALYKDGTTNQEMFVQAMTTMWERWMRGWALNDFAQAISDVGNNQFLTAFARILETVPERLSQIVGFYKGLWYSANPTRRADSRGIFGVPDFDMSPEGRAIRIVEQLVRQLSTIVEEGTIS